MYISTYMYTYMYQVELVLVLSILAKYSSNHLIVEIAIEK